MRVRRDRIHTGHKALSRKDRFKIFKTIVQAIVLLGALLLLINAIVDIRSYREPDRAQWSSDRGFVALSYFGVGRSGTAKLIARRELERQLGALHEQGYRTISQADIVRYYRDGQPLPDKALFLAFEDGRNDSALFAQSLLEKYNFKATMLSYADKMGDGQRKFLQPRDLTGMKKTGYWELGSGGYRLSYINVFDREGRFVGEVNEVDSNKQEMAYYNHYLMDFVRDANMIPTEDKEEMEARIGADYEAMRSIYTGRFGEVPGLYMIMHANALYEGMNPLVGAANDEAIRELFEMHFNREGEAYNGPEGELYDLTRLQVSPYWSTNHLLMKIRKDSGQAVAFVTGDEAQAQAWRTLAGAAEYGAQRLVLTAPPGAEGRLVLADGAEARDVRIRAELRGNVVGRQSVYVRLDEAQQRYARLTLDNNVLLLETRDGPDDELQAALEVMLDEVKWKEEDITYDRASVYSLEQALGGKTEDEGYPPNIADTRQLDIRLTGDRLSVRVDGDLLIADHPLASDLPAGIGLGAEASELHPDDDIYDGVFADVRIEALTDEQGGEGVRPLFTQRRSGLAGVGAAVRKAYNAVIDWSIETF
ncbi:polysaccharide deacetylase [Paenibacillus sp. IB182496]|uniref:Polysaccharide deacetylase n=1 Tax=Paenibacillus sabuli TaxID=2772509 RepID=A0A927BRZ1_9BACL|nr:polysaccharide deacetylase [Paenibacillus sabuli]MBD2844373.1 polysaccharide deacetylase [Paenibacillus sabuli]